MSSDLSVGESPHALCGPWLEEPRPVLECQRAKQLSTRASICVACGSELDAEHPGGLCARCSSRRASAGSSVSPSDSTGEPQAGLTEEETSLFTGRKLVNGRFTLITLLGRGGMGEVWMARDLNQPMQGGLVALKFLGARFRHDPKRMEFLRQELGNSRVLSHDNIVHFFDLQTPPGEPAFILMEYVEGKNLAELLREQSGGRFEWEQLKPLIAQLGSALQYAHSKWLIHRDLKPGNLLITGLQLKLADFGLAQFAPQSALCRSATRKGGGTLAYMSPQQMSGESPSKSDDIYSLGATLYELLTGCTPLPEGDDFFDRLQTTLPARISARLAEQGIESTVPDFVENTIAECLEKDPTQRPPSVVEVQRRLGLIRDTLSAGAHLAPRQPETTLVPPAEVEPETQADRARPRIRPSRGRPVLGWFVVGLVAMSALIVWLKPDWVLREKPTGASGIAHGPSPTEGEHGAKPSVEERHGLSLTGSGATLLSTLQVRCVEATNGALVIELDTSTQDNSVQTQLPPGSYRIQAGPRGTRPHARNWIDLPLSVNSSRNVVLDFTQKPFMFRQPDEGRPVTVECRDGWGNTLELTNIASRRLRATQNLIGQGRLTVTIRRSDLEDTNHMIEFDPSVDRSPPFLSAGPPLARPRPGQPWKSLLGFELVWIGAAPDGKSGFWAATDETTVNQYRRYAQAAGLLEHPPTLISVTANGWQDVGRTWEDPWPNRIQQKADHPVVGVSWQDAMGFCRWLTEDERSQGRLRTNQTYRLPTDAQWSLMADELNGPPYLWGTSPVPPRGPFNLCDSEASRFDWPSGWPTLDSNDYRDDHLRTASVHKLWTGPHGLRGLADNVSEWCLDRDAKNPPDIQNNDPELPLNPAALDLRMYRGGSWCDGAKDDMFDLRTAKRRFAPETNRCDRIGFRIVLVENP